MPNNDSSDSGRRNFIKTAAVAGAASLAAGNAHTAPKGRRPLRIGAMGVNPSFTSYSWSDLMNTDKEPNNPKRGGFDTSFLNMEITHAWDRDFSIAETYANRLDAKAVKKYDAMVGEVDGVIFGGMNETPWYKHLARPYIEAGIPVYLSRPFAYSMEDIDEILDLAAKHNTPILCTAKFEHYNEVAALKRKVEQIDTVKMVHAAINARDWPMHFHIMFMLMQVLGFDVREVALMTDGIKRNTYCQYTMLYNGKDEKNPFLCTVNNVSNQDHFEVTIYGDKYTVETNFLRSPDWRDMLLFRYAPQVIAMQRTFEGELFEPLENIRKKTELWLTGYYSHLERGGAPVKVGSLPAGWVAPYPEPGWLDESMFK